MDWQRGYRMVAGVWHSCFQLIKWQGRFRPDETKPDKQRWSITMSATSGSDGATTIEYGLIAAIIALGIIAGLDEVEAAIEFLYSFIDAETEGVTDRLAAE